MNMNVAKNKQETAQVGAPLKAQKSFLNRENDTFVKRLLSTLHCQKIP